MYGWRGRLGLILPNVNTVMEPEFNSVLPDGINCYVSRVIVRGEFNLSTLIEMAEGIERATEELKEIADVIGYGCTSGSFAKGSDWDQELIKRIEKTSGSFATTSATSLVKALKTLKIEKIALATPYTQEVNEQQKKFFENEGFDIVNMKGLNVGKHGGQGFYYPSDAFRLAKEVVTPNSDAILISCTNFRTFEIIEPLEND
ncbi:unnamed protein product, partial [marine sediment metagenome]